jgi:hypothetical protein
VRPTYGPEGRAAGLYHHLLKVRRQRRPRYGRKPRASFIPANRSIQRRPTEVEDRQTFGHWGADLLIFRREHGKATLTAMIERQTLFTILLPNPDRQSNAVVGRIGQAWQELPKGSCRTVTFDRGTEFAAYGLLADQVCTEAYFCDPHSPWQKGAVENAKGRIRRFLPGDRNMVANHQTTLNYWVSLGQRRRLSGGFKSASGTACPAACMSLASMRRVPPAFAASSAISRANASEALKFTCTVFGARPLPWATTALGMALVCALSAAVRSSANGLRLNSLMPLSLSLVALWPLEPSAH